MKCCVAAFGWLLLCALALPARAADLLFDDVPGDVVACVSWGGADRLSEAYESSHFAGVMRVPNVDATLGRLMPAVGRVMGEPATSTAALVAELQPVLLARPWVMFVGGPAGDGGGAGVSSSRLRFRAGFLCQPGEHGPAVRGALQRWADELAGPAAAVTWLDDGERLGVYVGYSERAVGDIRRQWRSLSDDDDFQRIRGRLMSRPAALGYVDVERLVRWLGGGQAGDGGLVGLVRRLEVSGVGRAIYAGRFRERMWHSRAFVEAPAPRRGVAALLDAAPIADMELHVVPRSATWLMGYRFEPAAVVDVLGRAWGRDARAGADEALWSALAEGLGDLWLAYSDPSLTASAGAGAGRSAVCLVHPLRDPAGVREALAAWAARVNAVAEQHEAGGEPTRLRIVVTEVDGLRVWQTAGAVRGLALAWTVADGRLYVARSTAALNVARAHAASPGNTITRNPRFQRMRERLGEAAGSRIAFADLQSTAPLVFQAYRQAMGIQPSERDDEGEGDELALPNLIRLMPYLLPSGRTTWVDDRGWHWRGVGPFPGCDLLSPAAMWGVGGGMLAAEWGGGR